MTSTPKFQFHKGTIRTLGFLLLLIQCLNFNSIKVQLERPEPDQRTWSAERFQFHKGTIRTTRLSDMKLSQNNFNSIKVQLELLFADVYFIIIIYFNSIKVQLEPLNKAVGGVANSISIP